MTPRFSRPLLAALHRLRDEGELIDVRLYAEGKHRLALRVEATVAGTPSPERVEETRSIVRRAVLDPSMKVAVRFDGRRP